MDSHRVFGLLQGSIPVPPVNLPDLFGLYALWDHDGVIRYIGCTPKATEGFNTRIVNKHVTGSECRSHKFSHAYCVGRMWRYCKKLHPTAAGKDQIDDDARLAKGLRTIIIRRFCGVTFVEIPQRNEAGCYFRYLTKLERAIQEQAPPHMRSWEGVRFVPGSEPLQQVDLVLSEHPALRSAADRQNALYVRHVQNREA